MPAVLPAEELRQRGGHAEARLFGQRPVDAPAIPCKRRKTCRRPLATCCRGLYWCREDFRYVRASFFSFFRGVVSVPLRSCRLFHVLFSPFFASYIRVL